MTTLTSRTEGTTLYIERVFDAPQALVFSAFANEDVIAQWFGPKDWTMPHSKMDFREGGQWHYCMKGPDDGSEWANMESWGISTYTKIDPPKQICYTDAFTDANGKVNEDMPVMDIEMNFVEEDGKTRIVNITKYKTEEDLQKVLDMGMLDGMDQTWDRLEDFLSQQNA